MLPRLLSCFLMCFVANGLARFGYVVLIPLLIISGSLTEAQSYQLGIAILVGYIFGSIFISILHFYVSLESIAKVALLLIALSFFACGVESAPFIWAWIWRFVAGVCGSALIILATPLCLPYTKEKKRGRIGGLIFSGVGAGAVISGFVLPFLATFGMDIVWLGLGGFCLFCFCFACVGLKSKHLPISKNNNAKAESSTKSCADSRLDSSVDSNKVALESSAPQKLETAHSKPHNTLDSSKSSIFSSALWLLMISYVLNAISYLPHTLFWVDYLVRDLGFSDVVSGSSWSALGFGAMLGSIACGMLGDKIGAKGANIAILLLKTLACFMPLLSNSLAWLNASLFIMGFTTMGNTTLSLAMGLKLCGKAHFAKVSSLLTFGFGIFQAMFAFVFVEMLGDVGYAGLFMICGILTLISAGLLVWIR